MLPIEIYADAASCGDDIAAIALLVKNDINIRSITAVSGNVWADEAFRNISTFLAKIGRTDIPVELGVCSSKIEERVALLHHQETEGLYIGALQDTQKIGNLYKFREDHVVKEEQGQYPPINCLLLGPATVLVEKVKNSIEYKNSINHIYVMGGSLENRVVTNSKTEFNFWFDAQAVNELLALSIPTTILTLDISSCIESQLLARRSLFSGFKLEGYTYDLSSTSIVCDEILAATIVKPEIVKNLQYARIVVESEDAGCYGKVTFAAKDDFVPEISVIQKVDVELLIKVLSDSGVR